MTETDTAPVMSDTGSNDSDNLHHFFCWCDEDFALCGKDLSEDEKVDEPRPEDLICMVCEDLVKYPCNRCGV